MDISGWKPFKLGELFSIEKGTRLTKANMKAGSIRFVGAANIDNGITAYISNADKIHPAGTLTVCYNGNGGTGKAFYQDEPFWASDDVHVLYPKFEMSKEAGLFLIPLIETAGERYDFTEKWTLEIMREDSIMLPAMADGEPDWKYINSFMGAVYAEAEAELMCLDKTNWRKANVDTSGWGDFKLSELFTIVPAKGKNSQLLLDGNDIAYIAASKENNGFNRMVALSGFEDWVSSGNCIQLIHIGDAAAGYANYIPNDFIAMNGKSSCAYNENLTLYSGVFIASVICATNQGKYSFADSWTGEKVPETIIKLPVTSSHEPDWILMESYMKTVITECDSTLAMLSECTR